MNPIRLGVVGLGGRGRFLMELAAEFEQVQVIAACDILARNWYQKQWGCNAPMAEVFPDAAFYEDYDRMLEESELDVVIVETGADIHVEFCIKALQKNVNVLSDIPVVAKLQEAEDLWKAAQQSKAVMYVGANPNYSKFTVLLNEFYEKGLLGKPYCMEAEYIHWSLPGSEFSVHATENGDWRKLLVPIRYCTHSLGPLLSVLDEELRKVSCFGTGEHAEPSAYASRRALTDRPSDDMMCANFQTPSGVVVRLMRNKRCRAKIGWHNYRVFGTEGYIERIDRFWKPVIRYNSMKELDTGLKEIDGSFMPPAYENNPKAKGHDGMDYAMLDHFFMAIGEGKGQPISLKAGLAMSIPGIYAEESARRGGEVLTIRYPWDEDWTTEI